MFASLFRTGKCAVSQGDSLADKSTLAMQSAQKTGIPLGNVDDDSPLVDVLPMPATDCKGLSRFTPSLEFGEKLMMQPSANLHADSALFAALKGDQIHGLLVPELRQGANVLHVLNMRLGGALPTLPLARQLIEGVCDHFSRGGGQQVERVTLATPKEVSSPDVEGGTGYLGKLGFTPLNRTIFFAQMGRANSGGAPSLLSPAVAVQPYEHFGYVPLASQRAVTDKTMVKEDEKIVESPRAQCTMSLPGGAPTLLISDKRTAENYRAAKSLVGGEFPRQDDAHETNLGGKIEAVGFVSQSLEGKHLCRLDVVAGDYANLALGAIASLSESVGAPPHHGDIELMNIERTLRYELQADNVSLEMPLQCVVGTSEPKEFFVQLAGESHLVVLTNNEGEKDKPRQKESAYLAQLQGLDADTPILSLTVFNTDSLQARFVVRDRRTGATTEVSSSACGSAAIAAAVAVSRNVAASDVAITQPSGDIIYGGYEQGALMVQGKAKTAYCGDVSLTKCELPQ